MSERGILSEVVFSLYILFPQPYRYLNSVLISVIVTMFRSTIAKLSMTSPVVINVPTRALLTSETMGFLCSVVGKFKYQKNLRLMFGSEYSQQGEGKGNKAKISTMIEPGIWIRMASRVF